MPRAAPHAVLSQAAYLLQGACAVDWICWGLLPKGDSPAGPLAWDWLSPGVRLCAWWSKEGL